MTNKAFAWSAKWIWHYENKDKPNSHWIFRKIFKASDSDINNVLRIIGQHHYQVMINGNFVGRGPGNQSPEYAYYDEYEIDKFLNIGLNLIIIKVYFCQIKPKPYAFRIFKGDGGLLAQIDSEKDVICETDSSWHVKLDSAYLQESPRLSNWLGYSEFFNAAKMVKGIHDLNCSIENWEFSSELKKSPILWNNLYKRSIPPLKTTNVYAANIYSQTFTSVFINDSSEEEIKDSGYLLHNKGGVCAINPINRSSRPRLVLDFSQTRSGYIHIKFKSGIGLLKLFMGESFNVSFYDSINLDGESFEWISFERRAFRFLIIEAEQVASTIKISEIYLEQVEYPFKVKGLFKSNDLLLNKIWHVCGKTVNACSFDYYEDCPTREQALWLGDVQIDGRVTAYQFGDMKLLKESLRRIAAIASSDGWLPSVGPGGESEMSIDNFLPDHSMAWFFCLADYFRFTGDVGLVEELFEVGCQFINYLEKQLDDNTLLRDCNRDDWWCFIDWSDNIDRNDCVAAIQMFLVKSLNDMSFLARALNRNVKAEVFQKKAELIKKSIDQIFWNDELGAYVDSVFGINYTKSKSISIQTNALSVSFNIADSLKQKKIYDNVFKNNTLPKIKTGYFNNYLVYSYFKMDKVEDALNLVREYWGGMLSKGATTFWEYYDSQVESLPAKHWSLCHGYACAPGYLLQAEFLGIKPKLPGWKAVEISPRLGYLSAVEACVPIPQGNINISLRETNEDLDIELDLPKEIQTSLIVNMEDASFNKIFINKKIVFNKRLIDKLPFNIKLIKSNLQFFEFDLTNL